MNQVLDWDEIFIKNLRLGTFVVYEHLDGGNQAYHPRFDFLLSAD